jgi:adapter protein MecA 1/2
MKFEKINEKKLRITYTMKELEGRNIDPRKLISNSEEAQDLILDMVDSLQDRFDFDMSTNRLMIEASSTPENDFVVTVTNLEEEDRAFTENTVNKKLLKLKQQKETLEKSDDKIAIIKFDSLENTIAFASAVYERFSVISALYKIKSDYYLTLKPRENGFMDKSAIMKISSDFGNYVPSAMIFEGYLKEHARLILARQALRKLAKEF